MNHYELLLRHAHLLDAHTLILGAGAQLPAKWLELFKSRHCQLLSYDWLTVQAHGGESEKTVFALPQNAQLNAEKIILFWPKSKALGLSLLELIANSKKECWVIGANDSGGKSLNKTAASLCTSMQKIDSARHCTLWQLTLKPQGSFNWLKYAQSFSYLQHAYLTLPGVFNHGHLDTGTALLLEYLPVPSQGKVLDLGCGSGVIGLSLKAREPRLAVTLADIDAMALQAARLNSARLNLQAEVVASDGLKNITGKFDFIFSNPPFHQGKDTNYQFAQNLFREAKKHLVADGQLWLVANNHLPYEGWAAEHFAQVEILAQEKGFKIILAY